MKGKIAIDRELCKGCKYCVLSCPNGVIEMDGEFNRSGYFPARVEDMEKCNGCALCAQMCPEIAIVVWREEGRKEKVHGPYARKS